MIVVAQCLRHRIVDGKGAGAIDQLRSSSRIARTCASRLRMNEGQRCLGDLDAKLGRYVGISNDAQQEIERGYIRVRSSGSAAAASVDACAFFAELLVRAINGVDRAALFSPRGFLGHQEIGAIADGRYLNKKRSEIMASGYVVHTLEAALWCVHRSTDFREAALMAANLGEDADTVAAVTGQLAGAIWGERGIPGDWRTCLPRCRFPIPSSGGRSARLPATCQVR